MTEEAKSSRPGSSARALRPMQRSRLYEQLVERLDRLDPLEIAV